VIRCMAFLLFILLGGVWHSHATAGEITFGPVEVTSAMGEPLHIKIPFHTSRTTPPENIEALWGVPTNYSHQGGPILTVVAKQEDGKDTLLIDSDRSMTIPFFTLLIRMAVEDRIIMRNFPVFLGERTREAATSAGSMKMNDPSVSPPPEHRASSSPAPSSIPMPPMAQEWILGLLVAVVLSGLFLFFLRDKRRLPRGGIARGFVRRRPMATPLPSRPEPVISAQEPTIPPNQEEAAQRSESPPREAAPHGTEHANGSVAAPEILESSSSQNQPSGSVDSTPEPKEETLSPQLPVRSTSITTNRGTKGVKISTVIRKRSTSSNQTPSKTKDHR